MTAAPATTLPRLVCTALPLGDDALLTVRHGVTGRDPRLPLPLLQGPFCDVWLCADAIRRGELDGVHWADDGVTLALHAQVDDASWCADPAEATAALYARLEAVLAARQAPHWWRIWNYLGGITEGEGDAERYRLFTLGRHRAWSQSGRTTPPPAATAIGGNEGLHVFALAGRRPVEAIENPRQVSSWDYPRDYGPRPPAFARASLLRGEHEALLFVSGTASILGHESRHAGDVRAQWDEARANIDAVLEAAQRRFNGAPAQARLANAKVYLARRDDAAVLESRIAALTHEGPVQVLLGEVCRRELAVEIEATYQIVLRPSS